jgi:hypothetical protein
MEAEQSVDEVLQLPQRKLVISTHDIDLSRDNNENDIFVLMVQESRGSAGGRGGGSGSRRIEKVMAFSCSKGICKKYFETADEQEIEQFEIPYSAVAMDIKLSTGAQLVTQGIVDPEFTVRYQELINRLR